MHLKMAAVVVGLLCAGACSTETIIVQKADKPGSGSPNGASPGEADASVDPAQLPPSGGLAADVNVAEIAVFQTVKINVVKNGAKVAKHNASIVAGRDALVRLYITPAAGYTARSLTAELRLENGEVKKVFKDTKTLSAASADGALASTFNFDVPGDALTPATTFTASVRDPATSVSAGAGGAAQYPAAGTPESLGVESDGPQLKVVVVPVKYAADGSNRVPDISAAQLEIYRQTMFTLYPAAKVEVTARAPVTFSSAINANGSGFSRILQSLQSLREQDRAADDVYYYGAIPPAASFGQYCGGTCVTGLSSVGDSPQDAFLRASVGIGFSGAESAITMAHELGHAHGREHSPCGGASGPDPRYPYTGGAIGVWGYNLLSKKLIAPTTGKDVMGYCQPEWVSDFTYQALFTRMQYVNTAHGVYGAFESPRPYRYVDVAEDGAVTWGETVTLRARPWGQVHEVTYHAPDGSIVHSDQGHFYPYDHLPGGYALVPEGPETAAGISIKGLYGRAISHLAR